MKIFPAICVVSALVLFACGVKKNPPANDVDNPAGCRAPTMVEASASACHIRLLAPRSCELVDLSGGKTFTVSWTSDSTYCQAPYTAYLAGAPYASSPPQNVNSWSFNLGGDVTHYSGSATLSAGDIANLGTNDGTLEWTVADPAGSHPASVVFRIKR